MPIRYRFLYPIDWPQISARVRFERAGGRCECCGRPHGATVAHLGNRAWYDAEAGTWRNRCGREIELRIGPQTFVRFSRVILAACHGRVPLGGVAG